LKPLTGKSLAEAAKTRGKDPITTIMDLIAEDESRIDTIYFLMSEENVKKEMTKPWISFGSDEASQAPEGVFLKSNPHPRAYGNFARVLGKYVREEKVISLTEAVRRLSGLPATNLGLDHRGGWNPRRAGLASRRRSPRVGSAAAGVDLADRPLRRSGRGRCGASAGPCCRGCRALRCWRCWACS